jgi:hypothetical protein
MDGADGADGMDGADGTDGPSGPVPLFFNYAVTFEATINGGSTDSATTVGQCAMIGESRILVKDLPIGGTTPISYDISLSGMRVDDVDTLTVDESLDIMIPADDGMERTGDAKYLVNGMHSYVAKMATEASTDPVVAIGDVTITGMADTKSTAIAVGVTLNAMDSHSRDVQSVSRDLSRSFTITGRVLDTADTGQDGTDPINEDGDSIGAMERTFSADDFPDRAGDDLPLLRLIDESQQNLSGTIQGAGDQDWFVVKQISPDYLLQLQLVGNAEFELIPVASVSEDDLDGHTLSGRPADLVDYNTAYDGLRCGDYYVKVTGVDETTYTLGWRVDLDGDATN